jgi:hypothetical protein
MSPGAFVHLTSSAPASEHVEELSGKLGRKERVLQLPDEMPNEGPLHDIDVDSRTSMVTLRGWSSGSSSSDGPERPVCGVDEQEPRWLDESGRGFLPCDR